ncbi:MAG: hypothetical protein AAGD35_18870 [Actinomycetota bacterium]
MYSYRSSSLQLIATTLGVVGAYWVSAVASEESISATFGLMVALAIGVLSWYVGGWASEVLRSKQFESEIAGTWLEHREYNGVTHWYCLIDVVHEAELESVHLRGTVYSIDGEDVAQWLSTSVYVSRPGRSILYFYDGESLGEGTKKSGYGRLDFSATAEPGSGTGVGFYENLEGGTGPTRFVIDKVDSDLLQQLNLPNLDFSNSRRSLVRLVHREIMGGTYTEVDESHNDGSGD